MLCKAMKLQSRDGQGEQWRRDKSYKGFTVQAQRDGTREQRGKWENEHKSWNECEETENRRASCQGEEERAGSNTARPGLRWVPGFFSARCKLASPTWDTYFYIKAGDSSHLRLVQIVNLHQQSDCKNAGAWWALLVPARFLLENFPHTNLRTCTGGQLAALSWL